jgi:hypothetical protein
VWQEHLASNVIQQKLFAVLQSQGTLPRSAPMIATACAPREEHQLGLLIFSLLAQRQGWRVEHLGQGTPLQDLKDFARAAKPHALVISVTTVVGLSGLIPWLNSATRPSAPIVFGGRLPNMSPALCAHLPGTWLGVDPTTVIQQLASVKIANEFWSPSRRARQTVESIQTQRLKIAGETVRLLMSSIDAKKHRTWDATNLNQATLFLIDALACALAFGAPDLIDAQRVRLTQAMPPRAVAPTLIDQHLGIFERVLNNMMTKDQARLYAPLIERMKNQTNEN